MKKTLALLLTLAMVLSLAIVPAAAATTTNNITTIGGTATHDVTATYRTSSSGSTGGGTVYSVDITWGDMAFTYTAGSAGTWNPSTHSVTGGTGGTGGAWAPDTPDGNKITVTNHSNAGITATLTYTAETAFSGITGTFSNTSLSLATAEGTTVANAPSGYTTLSLAGALASSTADSSKIGTITVTLS